MEENILRVGLLLNDQTYPNEKVKFRMKKNFQPSFTINLWMGNPLVFIFDKNNKPHNLITILDQG